MATVNSNSPAGDPSEGDDVDDDAIFAELEAEIENDADAAVREQLRLATQRAHEMQAGAHGRYMEITHEKEAIQISASEARCVVHFYHPDFRRCEILDKHLARLAPKYPGTRFIRVFVENVPWLVERLAVKVLPCVLCFVDGIAKDRLVGFAELGNKDSFETAVLEQRLANSSVLQTSCASSSRTGDGQVEQEDEMW